MKTPLCHFFVGFAALLLFATFAHANTYTPTIFSDPAVSGGVNTANGVITGGAGNGQVSLRSSIIASNANAGADTVNLPAGTYTLSLIGNDANCNAGDLDINGSLTLTGASAATTIIQGATAFNAGTGVYTNSIGDKVIGINQDGTHTGLTVAISNVTIRWGQNTVASGDSSFAFTGGGVDVFLTGTTGNTVSFTDCVITQNTNTNSYGGGVNVDSGASGLAGDTTPNVFRGTVTFTRVTISDNRTTDTVTQSSGGGVNLYADKHDVTFDTCTITANVTAGGTANGGGINIRHSNGGTITLLNTNVTNNTAGGYGGGMLSAFVQNISMTGGSISGNTALGVTAGDSPSGGGFLSGSNVGTTTSLTNVTINNNIATAGSAAKGGGFLNTSTGTTTLTNCTISGNSSDSGGGIYNTDGTLNVTGGLITNNTATLSGGGFFANNGAPTLKNLTISANTSQGTGGGFVSNGPGSATLTNVTVSNNRSDFNNSGGETGGGVARITGTVTLQNTLVGGNFRGTGATVDDVNGSVTANFSLIANTTGAALSGSNNVTGLDPRLGPLQDNGGLSFTHQLLGGSPALDAGSNALASGLTTDQRGTGYTRILDAGDADTTDEVDIGAYEAHPAVDDVLDQVTNEDIVKMVTVNIGDADLPITSVTASSSNTTLVPNANLVITGSGSSRTLTITPAANQFGTSTITVTVNGTENARAFSSSDTFVLTVNPIADTPSGTTAITPEDLQSATGLVLSRNAVDGAEVTHFKITGITGGTLFKNNGTTQINNNDFITFAEGNAGLKFTPAANLNTPAGDLFGFTIQAAVDASGTGISPTAAVAITVSEVNDSPVATDDSLTSVLEDSGLRSITISSLTANDSKGPANESGQTLSITAVSNAVGGTVAINGSNVEFTPSANFNGPASFDYTVQDNGTTAGVANPKTDLGTVTFSITTVNDKPTFSASNPPTSNEDAGAQTVNAWASFSAGPPNESSQAALGYSVSSVSNTALFSAGPAVATNGTLTYTPAANANGSSTFSVRVQDNGGTANGGVDLSDPQMFTITVNAVNDAPTITGQLPVSTAFNTARTIMFSDLQVTDIDNTYPTGFSLTATAGVNYSLVGNTVTPALNFFGTLAVPVKVNDGGLDSNTFQLSMTVNPDPQAVKSGGKIAKDPGGYKVSFIGNPGTQYSVQRVDFLPATLAQWTFISFQTADANGNFFIIENPPVGIAVRFYRAIIP